MNFFQRVINKFSETAFNQEQKGVKKYGKELNPHNLDADGNPYDWLMMAEEEIVDGFKYLLAEREKRDKLLKDINEMVDRIDLVASHDVDLVRAYCSQIKRTVKKINKNI